MSASRILDEESKLHFVNGRNLRVLAWIVLLPTLLATVVELGVRGRRERATRHHVPTLTAFLSAAENVFVVTGQEDPSSVGRVLYFRTRNHTHARKLLFDTRVTRTRTLSVSMYYTNERVTPEHEAAVRQLLATHVVETMGDRALASEIGLPNLYETKVHWPGFFGNGVVLTVSLAPPIWLMYWLSPQSRRRRLMQRGLCPRCKYDLRRTGKVGCPECGWSRGTE